MRKNDNMVECERCHAKVQRDHAVLLNFDQRTATYTDKPVPEKYSQGGFWFGADCARIALEDDAKTRVALHLDEVGADGEPEVVKALRDLVSADACGYERDTMRYEGLFENARVALSNYKRKQEGAA